MFCTGSTFLPQACQVPFLQIVVRIDEQLSALNFCLALQVLGITFQLIALVLNLLDYRLALELALLADFPLE